MLGFCIYLSMRCFWDARGWSFWATGVLYALIPGPSPEREKGALPTSGEEITFTYPSRNRTSGSNRNFHVRCGQPSH